MADIETSIGISLDTSNALAAIKNLQREISAFHTSLAKGSAGASNAAASLQKDLIGNINATGQFSASMTRVRSTTESFTNSLEKNKFSMGEYFRYAGAASKTFGKNFTTEFNTIEKVARERVKDLQTQFVSMGRDANGALQAIKIRPMVLDLKDAGTQMQITAQKQQIFNQLLKQGSTNLLNFGKNTQWAGRQLMVGFTLPLTVFGQIAAKTFMDLEKQALRFRRVYGELFTSPEETDSMVKALQELALEFTKYGVAVEKTMELAADAAAMGETGAGLLAQVNEANRLAVLGNVDQSKALETTISVTNAFAVATEDLANKIDFLNAVENQTVTSIEDLTIAIPKAGPVVKQLGGDVEDLAFFLTAMKEGGINASEGANALKSGLAALINPTGRAADMLAGFGINVKKIVESNKGDVKGLVIDFAQALDVLDPLNRAQAIEQLFGKFQFSRLSTLFQNVIAEGTQAERVLSLANSTVSELAALSNKELGNVADSTTFRFQKSIEELRAAIAPVGEQFLKAITPVIEFATKMLNSFNSMNEGVKNFVVIGGALLAGIGPVVLMAFGLLANGVANLIKGFAAVRGMFLKTKDSSSILGEQMEYMTQEQLEASSVAASLERVHQKLEQRFTSEAAAVENLVRALQKGIAAQRRFNPQVGAAAQAAAAVNPVRLNRGTTSVPGPRGAGDIIPALLSPGEAVIPAKAAQKYAPIIEGMIAGNIPGFNKGVMLGMPRSGKSTQKNRDAAEQIYQMFLQSSYRDTPPTKYGHQLSPTSGHSFPIFGLGGVYMGPGGEKVFVKPVMDETAAIAEMRGTQIARQAHGLKAPEQRIVVIRDPQDVTGTRRFLALESKLDSTFVNNDPMALFNEEQYFKQLVASLLRVDKDLAAGNMFGNVVADVGPAGVFTRASGVRALEPNLPSMEDQAMINLLGIKGGAKRAFAESTLGLMAGLTPQQYHQKMIAEIQQVLPMLKQTVASFGLTNPAEVDAYQGMIRRLEQGLSTDWSKFHAIHSAVKPAAPKQTSKPMPIAGYAEGVVSVPGPKGKGDIVPAMLSPGEAVIPAEESKKYAPLIQAMISGNIPGYKRGRFTQATAFGQNSDRPQSASHFAVFARSEEFARTLEFLKDEVSDIVVDLRTAGEKLEDGTRQVEKTITTMGEIETRTADGKLKDMAVGGKTYRGTTILESQNRNLAYEQKTGLPGEKVAAGASFTLEEVEATGKRAAKALAFNADMNEDLAEELRQMVVAGEQATVKMESTTASQEKLGFMYENAEKALVQSYKANPAVPDNQVQDMATERLARVRQELADLEAAGMDEEALLQEAKRKLLTTMVTSGAVGDGQTLQVLSGPSGSAGNVIPDMATARTRRGSFSTEEDLRNARGINAGRSSGQVASSMVFDEMAQSGEDFSTAAAAVFGASVQQNIVPAVQRESKAVKSAASEAGKSIVENVGEEIAKSAQTNSPSKKTKVATQSMVDGVVETLQEGKKEVKSASKGIVDESVKKVTTPGSSFVNPTTPTPRQTESFRLSKPVTQGPEAVKIAQNAGQDSMGPLKAYFTVVGANLRQVGKEFKSEMGITTSETMGPLKAYFTMVRSNLRDSLVDSQQEFKSIFSRSSDLGAAGKTASQKFREGLEAANPQVTIDGKKMGINFAAAAAGRQGGVEAVITKKTAELVSAANAAYTSGIRELPKQGAAAFRVSGDGVVQEITKSAMERARALAPAVGNAISSNFFDRIPKANIDLGDGVVGDSLPLTDAPSKLEKFNSTIMQSSFAISSLGSLAYMTGGELGQFGEAITGITTAMFALSTVTQLLISIKAKEAIQAAVANAKNIVLGSSTAKIFDSLIPVGTSFKNLGSVVKEIIKALPKFVKILGIAAAAFGAFLLISDQVNKAKEKERRAIEGMASVANMAAEKLEKIAQLTGTELQPSPMTLGASGLALPNVESRAELTEVAALATNKEFTDSYKDEIASLRDATLGEAELALNSLSVQLFANNFSEKNIKNIINALQSAAGRNDVVIDFKSLGISTGKINFDKIINDLKVGSNDLTTEIKTELVYEEPKNILDAFDGETSFTDALAGTFIPANIFPTEQLTAEAQGAVNTYAASMRSAFEALSAELANGDISLQEYNNRFAELLALITTSPQSADIMQRLFGTLAPDLDLSKITDVNDQIALLQALAAGVSPDSIRIALEGIMKGGPEKAKALEVLSLAIGKVKTETAELGAQPAIDFGPIDVEIEKLDNTKAAYDALIAAKVDEKEAYEMANDSVWAGLTLQALESGSLDALIAKRNEYNNALAIQPPDPKKNPATILADAIVAMEEERQLKIDLEAAGLNAADAQTTLNTEVLKGAAAAAVGTPQWKDFLVQLEKYKKLAPSTTGGAPEKTPFEKATEALQDQRKELINTTSAYTKLRKGGFSVAQAFEAAKDPITAAAVASTKVGTPKWRELVGLLRQVDKLAAASRLRDLTRENMSELSLKKDLDSVSKSLEKAGYSAEQVQAVLDDMQSDPANAKRLAKDLKDGKVDAKDIREYLKSIRSVKVEVSIEDLESKVSAAFSQVSELFSARREAIEIDFEFGTNDSGKNAINPFTGKIFNTKQIDKEIKQAEQYIAERQFKIDDNEYQLQGIQDKEDKINETYDKRIEALSDINDINDELAQQQKAQLTLADALTSGDMASAARAVQEMRAQAAEKAAADQEKLLEKAREAELKAVRSDDLRSRVQIETAIRDLKQEIIEKEEKILEPAQRALDLANDYKDAAFDSIDYLGKNESEWKKIEAGVKLAKVEAEAYKKAIEDALLLIPKLQAAYAGAQGTATAATAATVVDPATERQEKINQLNAQIQANRDIVTKDKTISPEDKKLMAENIKLIRDLNALNSAPAGDSGKLAFASGGFVSGPGTPTSDSIPAMLSNGEYVINAKTTKQIGLDTLNAINFGKVSGFAKGGQVGKPEPKKPGFLENLANMAKSIFMPTVAGSAMANRQDASALNKFNLYEENKPFLISNTTNQSKKPTVAELLAAAKKQDNQVVNKTLAAKSAPRPTGGGTSATVKAKTGEVPFLPSQQMLDRGRAGEQSLSDLPALFVPLLGNVLSANALVGSLERKDYLMATLDAIGVIPGFGNIVKGAAKSIDTVVATRLAEKILKDPKVSIAFPRESTSEILESGFTSRFDPTKTKDPMRLSVEDRMGVPKNTPASARPVYGAIQNKFNLPLSILKRIPGTTGNVLRVTDPRTNALTQLYGGKNPAFASLNAKDLRGTYTIGDSFAGQSALQLEPGFAGRGARDLIQMLKQTPLPYIETQLSPLRSSSMGASGIRTSLEEISQISTKKTFRDSLASFRDRLIGSQRSSPGGLKTPNRVLSLPAAIRNSLDKNYVLTRREMRDTVPAPPGMPGSGMKVAPYEVLSKVEANSPSLFNELRKQTTEGPATTAFRERRKGLPLRGFEDYPAGFQNFMAKVLDNGNLPYRTKRAFELGVSDARESLLNMKSRAAASALMAIPGISGGGVKALKELEAMRHRSHKSLLEPLHPSDVPIDHARMFGPGTYFAKNQQLSDGLFSGFGPNVYKPKTSLMGSLQIAAGRGFLDIDRKGSTVPHLTNLSWDDPIIQDFIKQGYIGLKHGDAYTTWLTGTSSRHKLVKVTPPKQGFDPKNYYAMGGLVKPKYFNAGGMVKAYARGGDVVPSMLTPGEFVMSKYAVQNYGVDKMKALNNGTLSNDSVYNYSVNVSVQTDSNPDQIARAVLGQIKQIDAQRIRGNRF